MTPPRSEGFVRMPVAEFEAILTRAAEEGAKRALADVGLDGDEAVLDIRDLRFLVECIRQVRRKAIQTAVRTITAGVTAGRKGRLRSQTPSHPPGPPEPSDDTLQVPCYSPASTETRFRPPSFEA